MWKKVKSDTYHNDEEHSILTKFKAKDNKIWVVKQPMDFFGTQQKTLGKFTTHEAANRFMKKWIKKHS